MYTTLHPGASHPGEMRQGQSHASTRQHPRSRAVRSTASSGPRREHRREHSAGGLHSCRFARDQAGVGSHGWRLTVLAPPGPGHRIAPQRTYTVTTVQDETKLGSTQTSALPKGRFFFLGGGAPAERFRVQVTAAAICWSLPGFHGSVGSGSRSSPALLRFRSLLHTIHPSSCPGFPSLSRSVAQSLSGSRGSRRRPLLPVSLKRSLQPGRSPRARLPFPRFHVWRARCPPSRRN